MRTGCLYGLLTVDALPSRPNKDNNKGEIYVMDVDGKNPRNLTINRHADVSPAWLGPTFAIAPAGRILTIWGWLKQVDR